MPIPKPARPQQAIPTARGTPVISSAVPVPATPSTSAPRPVVTRNRPDRRLASLAWVHEPTVQTTAAVETARPATVAEACRTDVMASGTKVSAHEPPVPSASSRNQQHYRQTGLTTSVSNCTE